jgi:aminoacylase
MESNGNIYARGAQDTKCIGIQYLEAIRNLNREGFKPLRTIHISFVPDEEIGGGDGFQKFVNSSYFAELNVGVCLDEGLTSPTDVYRISNAEKTPWWLEIKAEGYPGHGSKLYDNSAIENLMKSLEAMMKFRAAQFDNVKAGLNEEAEVTSINVAYLKAGQETPTVRSYHETPVCSTLGSDP